MAPEYVFRPNSADWGPFTTSTRSTWVIGKLCRPEVTISPSTNTELVRCSGLVASKVTPRKRGINTVRAFSLFIVSMNRPGAVFCTSTMLLKADA